MNVSERKRRKRLLSLSILSSAGMMGLVFGGVLTQASASTSSITITEPAMSTRDPTQNGPEVLLDQGTILEGLYGYNASNQLIPKIAKSYKVSDGGKVWTFYLRNNAKWSNGEPVTANDFYYAWMRLLDPKDNTGAVWQSVLTDVQGANQYHAGQVPANQVGIKVLGPYAIQLTLTAPHDIRGMLAIAGSMPLYPGDVKAHPSDWFMPQNFVGDGPYVVKSFTVNGAMTLQKNPYYVPAPGDTGANVDQVNIVPTPTVPVEDFMANKLDLAWITNPSDFRYIETHPSLKSEVQLQPGYEAFSLEFDKSSAASPLDNKLVRQAIAMAINRTPIVQAVLHGMGGATTTFGPPQWPPTKYEHGIAFNLTKAKQLLAQAGYPNGKGIPTLYLYCKTTADDPVQVSVAEALAQEFQQELGINFKISPVASSILGQMVYNGLVPGVKPGYVIAGGNAPWIDSGYLPLQANQMASRPGTVGPASYRQHFQPWYFDTTNPADVSKYGNPNDSNMGTKWSQWSALNKEATTDMAWLSAWMNRQPKWYQQLNQPAPGQSNQEIWSGLIQQWKAAKTAADKHQIWVTAYQMVSNYSIGNALASIGLSGQVYVDQHEPTFVYDQILETAKLGSVTNLQQGYKLAAQIADQVIQSGYREPLYYNYNIFLERSNFTGAQSSPYGWLNFHDLQYIKAK